MLLALLLLALLLPAPLLLCLLLLGQHALRIVTAILLHRRTADLSTLRFPDESVTKSHQDVQEVSPDR